MVTSKGPAFLNAYRFIIAGPGAGKSLAVKFVKDVIQQTELVCPIMPASITKESLIDELATDKCRVMLGFDAAEKVNAGLVLASEYGVLIGHYINPDFFHTMCTLWDGEHYKETRRSLPNPIEIFNPYVNMLAGTQPTHWAQQFPRKAWSMGYASRCDFTFSSVNEQDVSAFDPVVLDLSGTIPDKVPMFIREVAHDFQIIQAQIHHPDSPKHKPAIQLLPSDEAQKFFRHWYMIERLETEFREPALLDYNTRRAFRAWRDGALMSLLRGNTDYKTVEAEDFAVAINLHSENDAQLLEHYYRAYNSEDGQIAESIWSWCVQHELKTNTPVSFAELKKFTAMKTDQHKVDKIIRYLVDVGALIETKSFVKPNGVKVNLSTPVYTSNRKWHI